MGFEALLGACEHCKSDERNQGNFIKVYEDPKVSKETEVVDFFTKASENSVEGKHRELGFPHFEYRTVICGGCLEQYETTDKLIDQMNSQRQREFRHCMSGGLDPLDLQVDKVLIVYLDRNSDYWIVQRNPNPISLN